MVQKLSETKRKRIKYATKINPSLIIIQGKLGQSSRHTQTELNQKRMPGKFEYVKQQCLDFVQDKIIVHKNNSS